jgi:hypothetical protein
MVGGAALSLAAATRAVAHISAYHGYDPTIESEQLFLLTGLNLGTAATQAEKTAAFRDLNALV